MEKGLNLVSILLLEIASYRFNLDLGWSSLNSLSGATSEMGSAMRHEVLDDHWSSYNWQKIIGFGIFLIIQYNRNTKINLGSHFKRSLKAAQTESEKQHESWKDYTTTFKPEEIIAFSNDVKEWNKDSSYKPNPYEEPVSSKLFSNSLQV